MRTSATAMDRIILTISWNQAILGQQECKRINFVDSYH
jgi:hypothetical protein